MMKDLNYGADYKYPHDFPGNWVEQNYFPEVPSRPIFYKPSEQDKINRGTPSK
jgi:putative ATPase